MSKKLEKLQKLAAKGKGKKIGKFISSKDPEVVIDAINALGICGGEDAINSLTSLAGSPDKIIKIAAIKALGLCGGEYNATLFTSQLKTEKDPEILAALKETLEKVRGRK